MGLETQKTHVNFLAKLYFLIICVQYTSKCISVMVVWTAVHVFFCLCLLGIKRLSTSSNDNKKQEFV